MSYAKISVFIILLLLTSCAEKTGGQDEAIKTVAASLDRNELGIQARDLRGKENPKGEGRFVYVRKTRFSGVERYIVWLVIDGKAYPLNGATKDVTPALSWPRDAPEQVWNKTGLNQYSATEAIEIVFGSS